MAKNYSHKRLAIAVIAVAVLLGLIVGTALGHIDTIVMILTFIKGLLWFFLGYMLIVSFIGFIFDSLMGPIELAPDAENTAIKNDAENKSADESKDVIDKERLRLSL